MREHLCGAPIFMSQDASAHHGVRQEVSALYRDHHTWLRTWLRRKLGDAHHAADLAHDIFLRLLLRDEPVAAQEPRAFLTTAAKHALLNHYRRQRLEQAYLEALAQAPAVMAMSPEERALLLEALDEIDRMLDQLPAPVRQAFLMAQLEGMPQLEIAAALGVSLSTVKRYIVQAGMQCYFAVHG